MAWAAASELERVPLEDALALLLLQADQDPQRFERGAVRWLGRACLELKDLQLREAVLIAAALSSLRVAPGAASAALAEVCDGRGLREAAGALDTFSERAAR
jgi:hypothetical protein